MHSVFTTTISLSCPSHQSHPTSSTVVRRQCLETKRRNSVSSHVRPGLLIEYHHQKGERAEPSLLTLRFFPALSRRRLRQCSCNCHKRAELRAVGRNCRPPLVPHQISSLQSIHASPPCLCSVLSAAKLTCLSRLSPVYCGGPIVKTSSLSTAGAPSVPGAFLGVVRQCETLLSERSIESKPI